MLHRVEGPENFWDISRMYYSDQEHGSASRHLAELRGGRENSGNLDIDRGTLTGVAAALGPPRSGKSHESLVV